MPPPPDRALRRHIAQLASLDAQDIEAILDQMETGRRKDLLDRLKRYRDEIGGPNVAVVNKIAPPSGLSPWLAARAGSQTDHRLFGDIVFGTGGATVVGVAPFRMTPMAISALRNAVAASAGRSGRSGAGPADAERGVLQRLRAAFATTVSR